MEFSLTVRSLTTSTNNQLLFSDENSHEQKKTSFEIEGDTLDLRFENDKCFVKYQNDWLPITDLNKIYLRDCFIEPHAFSTTVCDVQNVTLSLRAENKYEGTENKNMTLTTTEFTTWQTEALLEIGFSSHTLRAL